MTPYRIHSFDRDGCTLIDFKLHCDDDLQALSEGRSIGGAHYVEIWNGERLVARIEPFV